MLIKLPKGINLLDNDDKYVNAYGVVRDISWYVKMINFLPLSSKLFEIICKIVKRLYYYLKLY